jgi:4-hydroxy-tetrahydrodipicolinate reductase
VTVRVALFGVGRLGREIVALAPERDAIIVASFGRGDAASADALRQSTADVAIDISVAEAVERNVDICVTAGIPIVIGVTGWHDATVRVLQRVADQNGGVLIAPNFSVGATLFAEAVAHASRRFSAALGFGAAIVETHHAMKKDAPSGTARSLAEVVRQNRGAVVPVSSVRVGHVPGVHTLILDAAFEQVTLTHEARDRRVFADGALLAARWMRNRTGAWTMADVVRDLTGENR